jgi:hypothetical protein
MRIFQISARHRVWTEVIAYHCVVCKAVCVAPDLLSRALATRATHALQSASHERIVRVSLSSLWKVAVALPNLPAFFLPLPLEWTANVCGIMIGGHKAVGFSC